MKKSTILSLATAGAIVATSAFTFAAWDQTSDTTAVASLSFTEPKIIDLTTEALTFNNDTLDGTTKEAKASMAFDVSGTGTGDSIKLSLVDNSGNPADIPTGLTVTFTKGSADSETDLSTTNGVASDDSFTKDAVNTYGVKVTVNTDITPTDAKTLHEKGFDVAVKAEIVSPSV